MTAGGKNPPTLADACIASAFDKHMAGGPNMEELRAPLLLVASARKFVLDQDMSRYLLDLSRGLVKGGLRKRINQIENVRRLARLPHPLTWIEFDFRAHVGRACELGMRIARGRIRDDEPFPERCGWLLRQHPKIDTAVIAMEAHSTLDRPGRGMLHPVSIAWCADDTPLPWRRIKLWKGEDDESYVVQMQHYRSTQVGWTFTYCEDTSARLMHAARQTDPIAVTPTMPARTLWALLATINDLPVEIEHVQPSKGYIARGSYRKFVAHSVVHLTVPVSRWRALINKTAALIRRRAHQVRGHWRKDWRAPLTPTCEHEFGADMICRKCHGHKIWIAEHQRGDAALGFVTHDYDIHHETPP